MADIFIVKMRFKTSLWFLALGIAFGLFGTWYSWKQVMPGGEGEDRFFLFAIITIMLGLAWLIVFITFFFLGKIMRMQTEGGKKTWKTRVPWWSLKYIAIIIAIGVMTNYALDKSAELKTAFDFLRKGKIEVVGERIDENPELLEKVEYSSGKTLMGLALDSGNPKAIAMLLSKGAKLDPAVAGLYLVDAVNKPELLDLFLKNGVPPDSPNKKWVVPLHYAIETLNKNALATLLAAGADINGQDGQQKSPLMLAILTGQQELIQMLFDGGADISIVDARGDTALHIAVEQRNSELVRTLVEKGADYKKFNYNKMAPIHLAALNGETELVEYFLELDPTMISLRDLIEDLAPFDAAIRRKHFETARFLLAHGAKIDRVMNHGFTAIHLMLFARKYDIVEFLIEEGADVQIVCTSSRAAADDEGETAYHFMRKKRLMGLIAKVDKRDGLMEEASTNEVDSVESTTDEEVVQETNTVESAVSE